MDNDDNLLITNARVFTFDDGLPMVDRGFINLLNGKIADIGAMADLPQELAATNNFDAQGMIVMPANICAHTHFYSAFSRGMPLYGAPASNFIEILQRLWWPLDRALTLPATRKSAELSLLDAIKGGTSLLIDHHASQTDIRGSLAEIAEAVLESGLRANLCYEVSDRNGTGKRDEGIAENLDFIKAVSADNWDRQRINARFGLHASLTLSEETLNLCREGIPDGFGFHVHLAEGIADQEDSLKKYGKRVTQRFYDHGILGQNCLVAHGVHLDQDEINLLADTRTWLAHQPRSNMNNAVSLPAIEKMLAAGIPVCVGNDGFSNAMWDEWKMIYLVHKHRLGDPRAMGADVIVNMAVKNNRRLAETLFDGLKTGIIAADASADLIFVDYPSFTELNPGNLPWQIIFGFDPAMIKSLMVGGKWIMKDRNILTLDEEKIIREAYSLSKDVWKRYQIEAARMSAHE